MTVLHKKGKRFLLPAVTLGVFIAITCVVAMAKASKNNEAISTISKKNIEYFESPEINESEREVLSYLHGCINEYTDNKEDTSDLFYTSLVKYFQKSDIDLKQGKLDEILEKANILNEIISLEKKSDFKKMSLDARSIALKVAQQIYDLCGLQLSFNILGDIEEIRESTGEILYKNQIEFHKEFHMDVFVSVVAIIFLLLIVCILIARKNHLFQYAAQERFDEEKYAS